MKLTEARKKALEEAVSERGYEPVGAAQHRMARKLREEGLLRRSWLRPDWQITDSGLAALLSTIFKEGGEGS